MAEHDGAGYPLAYCLLSTATSIEIGKRTKALNAWASCLRDKYGINPDFCHLDKDMGEIGMARGVWKMVKLQLCWWHMRKALRERLAKRKLSTTPYNGERAREQFSFIDPHFRPAGKADPEEYEGGMHDSAGTNGTSPTSATTGSNSINIPPFKYTSTAPLSDVLGAQKLSIKIPAQPSVKPADSISNHAPRPEPITEIPTSTNSLRPQKLVIKLPANYTTSNDNQPTKGNKSDQMNMVDVKSERRTFCPEEHRQPIINMVERHFCAHPLIPGYCHPTPAGIREWAVREIYGYCVANDLREAWAYLWENWYRRGRWELWARADCEEIPVLKTTMIMESQ